MNHVRALFFHGSKEGSTVPVHPSAAFTSGFRILDPSFQTWAAPELREGSVYYCCTTLSAGGWTAISTA